MPLKTMIAILILLLLAALLAWAERTQSKRTHTMLWVLAIGTVVVLGLLI